LPIVEFAIQGHIDVITLTFTLLAVLSATNTSMRGRILTSFFIGLAALTKIYPLLLLAAFPPILSGRNDGPIQTIGRLLRPLDSLLQACLYASDDRARRSSTHWSANDNTFYAQSI